MVGGNPGQLADILCGQGFVRGRAGRFGAGSRSGLRRGFSFGRSFFRDRGFFNLLGGMTTAIYAEPRRDDDADNPVRVAGFIPTPDHLVPVVKERFGIEEIFQGYGQSESLAMFSRVAKDSQKYKPGSLGDPATPLEK